MSGVSASLFPSKKESQSPLDIPNQGIQQVGLCSSEL